LEIKLEQQRLIGVLKSNQQWLSQEDWEFLFENPTNEANEPMLDYYPKSDPTSELADITQNVHTYFGRIEPEDAIECLYGRLIDDGNVANIIRANNLFSPSRVLELLDKGHAHLAATCANINKSSYDREDIPLMEKLAERFDNLPDTGEIKLVKGGMMSKEKEKFVCEEGHQNHVSNEFCGECGKNIKGLTRRDVEVIAEFNNKLSLLKEMLK
jgi:hypothetical protein